MSSKIPPRLPLTSSSHPSIKATIWPQGVKQAYATLLIQRFGGALSSAHPKLSRSYTEIASSVPLINSSVPLQLTATTGKISLAQLNVDGNLTFTNDDTNGCAIGVCTVARRAAMLKIVRNVWDCFTCGSLGHILSRCPKSKHTTAAVSSLHPITPLSEPDPSKNSSWQPFFH
jgi:Zinc knuckle